MILLAIAREKDLKFRSWHTKGFIKRCPVVCQVVQSSHILKLNLMVIRECAKLCFIPETGFVQEIQMHAILANNRNLGIKLFPCPDFNCYSHCVCGGVCTRVKYNWKEMIFGDSAPRVLNLSRAVMKYLLDLACESMRIKVI